MNLHWSDRRNEAQQRAKEEHLREQDRRRELDAIIAEAEEEEPDPPSSFRHLWPKYGLSLSGGHEGEMKARGALNHNLVARYLDDHPYVRARYKKDQTGEFGYYRILDLAEEYYGTTFESEKKG